SNPRPSGPKPDALPGCAMPRSGLPWRASPAKGRQCCAHPPPVPIIRARVRALPPPPRRWRRWADCARLCRSPGAGQHPPARVRCPCGVRRRASQSIPDNTIRAAAAAAAAGVDMQATVESLGDHERRMTFSLPADRLKQQVDQRLGEIARTTRLKGFRPGKVPRSVIEQRFGKQVRDEVREQLLRESFNQAVRENELQLAGNPDIQPAGDDADDGRYVATFELVPDFGDIDV